MKYILILLIIFISIQSNATRRILKPASWGGNYIFAKDLQHAAGDSLVLSSKYPLTSIALDGFHGTKEKPIVIINEGYFKTGGIGIINCSYLIITGSGSTDKYGIYISNPTGDAGPGIDITGRSAFIEVNRVETFKKGYGIWCKQEVSCADSLNYPAWKIDNININNCYFHNTGQDVLYMGSTNPTGGERTVNCNGKDKKPTPLRLSNISIRNNIIDSCNRTAIQLSGCDDGINDISNNTITRTGFERNASQGSGIILGGLTRNTSVANNKISQTFQHGIWVIGQGKNTVEGNVIDSTGYLGKIYNPGYAPIAIGPRAGSDSLTVVINNNITGLHGYTNDIEIAYDAPIYTKKGNYTCNNKTKYGAPTSIKNIGNIILEQCGITAPPITYSNKTVSATFTKNNCPLGYIPGIVSYTIAANLYTSQISQADADKKANEALILAGQAFVNETTSCTPIKVILGRVFIGGWEFVLYSDGTATGKQ